MLLGTSWGGWRRWGRLGGFISKVRELIVKEVMGVEQDHFSDFNVFGKLRVRQGKLLENISG
jgi:hypothetical protein